MQGQSWAEDFCLIVNLFKDKLQANAIGFAFETCQKKKKKGHPQNPKKSLLFSTVQQI